MLSKGGSLILIKSSTVNILIYHMPLMTTYVSMSKKLKTIQCRFLWGDSKVRMRYHLVASNVVKHPIQYDGLGLRYLVYANEALQKKWL